MSKFQIATKTQAKLRLALQGPSGGGKTYSALSIASHIAPLAKVAVIDTEHGSAAKYASDFPGFSTLCLTNSYAPVTFIEAIKDAEQSGFDVVIIDSLTHAWNGPGGFLEMVDEECKRMIAKNHKPDSFAAWKNLTPIYNRLVQAIVGSKCHVICCLRAKQEYEKVKNESTGKVEVKKVGMAPEMRDNFQYEMDIEGMLTMDHDFIVGKTRCPSIDGKVYNKPGKEFAGMLTSWLSDGAVPVTPTPSLKDAYAAVMAKTSMTKQIALDLAAEVCGHQVNTAADIKPDEIAKVIACWEAQP